MSLRDWRTWPARDRRFSLKTGLGGVVPGDTHGDGPPHQRFEHAVSQRMNTVSLVSALLVAASLRSWALTAPTGAPAHHSIAGVYDSTASITLDGVVSAFHFVNPHPFI